MATPEAKKDTVVVGDKVNETGKVDIVSVSPAPAPAPVQRSFTSIAVAAVGTTVTTSTTSTIHALTTAAGATTVFSDNKLLSVNNNATGGDSTKWSETGTPQPESSFKSIDNVSDASFIGWGTWTTGQRELGTDTVALNHVHYVAGRQTPNSEMSTLMTAGGTASYTLVGNTSPTRSGVAGTLTGGTFSVNFGSTQYVVNTTLNTSFGNIVDSVKNFSSSPTFSGTYVNGVFIGTNAARVGLTYAKDLGAGVISGAAAFQK